jgi:hypothetical protein
MTLKNPTTPEQDAHDSENKKPESVSRSEKRRKLIKSVAASGGVAATALSAGHWFKPVVDTVVLPSHAATSGVRGLVTDIDVASVIDNVLDAFIGTAYADLPNCTIPKEFCIDFGNSGEINGITIGGTTVSPFLPVTTKENVQFTVIAKGIIINGSSHDFTIVATISGNAITGNISCTGVDKSPVSAITFSGTILDGSCVSFL